MNIYKDGLTPDPRSQEEKAKDYQHPAGSVVINWVDKPQATWKKYIPREQDGSLSCCGQSLAKALEILTGKVQSAHPPYRSRVNYPAGGMYLQDLGNVAKNIGTTLEDLDVSQWINETRMNLPFSVSTPTKVGKYYFPNVKNIDEIAEAIEVYGHCILIVHCYKSEWTAIPVSNGQSQNGYDFGHCICATDYTMYNGKKALVIEDSTGHFNSLPPLKDGQRIITEDFLISRFDGAMYVTMDAPEAPYLFSETLRMGDRGLDVKQLQKRLKIASDGIFGTNTKKAVIVFQKLHKLTPDGVVGKNTNSFLNKPD